jgi:hypothetical protein
MLGLKYILKHTLLITFLAFCGINCFAQQAPHNDGHEQTQDAQTPVPINADVNMDEHGAAAGEHKKGGMPELKVFCLSTLVMHIMFMPLV